jgi:hypothetical protein
VRVTFLRLNPARDAGIKPRVSPQTRGHEPSVRRWRLQGQMGTLSYHILAGRVLCIKFVVNHGRATRLAG